MKISEMIRQASPRQARPTMESNKVADDLWQAMMKDKALFGIFDNPENKVNWQRIEQAFVKSMAQNIKNVPPKKRKQIAGDYLKWMKDRLSSEMLETYKAIKEMVITNIPDRLGNV